MLGAFGFVCLGLNPIHLINPTIAMHRHPMPRHRIMLIDLRYGYTGRRSRDHPEPTGSDPARASFLTHFPNQCTPTLIDTNSASTFPHIPASNSGCRLLHAGLLDPEQATARRFRRPQSSPTCRRLQAHFHFHCCCWCVAAGCTSPPARVTAPSTVCSSCSNISSCSSSSSLVWSRWHRRSPRPPVLAPAPITPRRRGQWALLDVPCAC